MEWFTLNSEWLLQILIGVIVIYQLQQMIDKIGAFSDRLVVLETEHKMIHSSCNLSRSSDKSGQYLPTD